MTLKAVNVNDMRESVRVARDFAYTLGAESNGAGTLNAVSQYSKHVFPHWKSSVGAFDHLTLKVVYPTPLLIR